MAFLDPRSHRRWLMTMLTALLMGAPGTASAWSGGIGGTDLPAGGCVSAGCHDDGMGTGTTTPSIAFSSPLIEGVAATITVTVTNGTQSGAGFNLDLSQGDLANPPGGGAQRYMGDSTEATHTMPNTSPGSGPWVWTLSWTPQSSGNVSYTLWGNAVNRDFVQTGDTPAMISGNVTVLRPNGDPCGSGGQCASGFCADGVCCNSACNPDACRECDRSGSLGMCVSLPAGSMCCPTLGETWNGSSCTDPNECAGNPCSPGMCTETPTGPGWTPPGYTCDATDECDSTPCDTDPLATCVDTMLGTPGGVMCTCPNGSTGSGVGSSGCNDPNECVPNPCPGGGACTELPVGPTWMSPGYVCNSEDECVTGTPCDTDPLATCVDTMLGTPGGVMCTCPNGATGSGFGSSGCNDPDECASNPCAPGTCTEIPVGPTWMSPGYVCDSEDECVTGTPCDTDPAATCVDTMIGNPGGVMCTCPNGATGSGLGPSGCTDPNECSPNPCPGGGACTQTPIGPGWTAPGYTCDATDECDSTPCDTDPLATCVDTMIGNPGGVMCTCPNGATGSGLGPSGCTDPNECSPNPCASGTCMQTPIGSGWSPPGYTCDTTDECLTGTPCDTDPVASCTDTMLGAPGGVTCTCPSGYTGSGMGPSGCADIDECMSGTDDCDANASCTNTPPGSFSCACNGGYEGDGRTCTDIDECMSGTDDCDANASCTNTPPGSFSCACNGGFSGDGRTCADIDECLDPMFSGRCSSVATCVNEVGSWRCDCNDGFRGDGFTCEDIDECVEGTHGCHMNATCTNEVGGFTCACNEGYRGSGFDCVDIDECADGTDGCPLNAVCINQVGMPNTCECASGFSNVLDPDACEVVCGDAQVGPGEGCDQGELVDGMDGTMPTDGDGCSAVCEIEDGWACFEPSGGASVCTETCGDGFVDETEECDDGVDNNSDTEPDACRTTCELPTCGDYVTDSGEACDDGLANDDTAPNACRTSCDLAYCGDGVVDDGELCDPGGLAPGAATGECTTGCAGDAGIDEADPPVLTGGACTCRATAPSGAPWSLGLWLLTLVGWRRRR